MTDALRELLAVQGKKIKTLAFQKSPKPFLYSKWINNSSEFTLGIDGDTLLSITLHTISGML